MIQESPTTEVGERKVAIAATTVHCISRDGIFILKCDIFEIYHIKSFSFLVYNYITNISHFCYNIPNNRRIVGVNNAVNMPLRVNPKLAYAPYLLLISIAVEVPTA